MPTVNVVRKVLKVWMVLSVPSALLVIVALQDRPARRAKRAARERQARWDRQVNAARLEQLDKLVLLDPRVRVVRLGNAGQSAPRAIRDHQAQRDWPAPRASRHNR